MKLDELREALREPEEPKPEEPKPEPDLDQLREALARDDLCCTTCGHARTEHVAGYAGCFASACDCSRFEWMP